MNMIKVTQKEYHTLNPLLINMIGKKSIFHQIKKSVISLEKKI